ncbi:MAG: CFI-box-CTERM domain-containing protein [Thermoproteota archaeon]
MKVKGFLHMKLFSLEKMAYAFLMILLLMPLFLGYLPASGSTRIKEFFEDCAGTKYTLRVSLEDTWILPQNYEVTITITVTDMGGNQYLRVVKITVGLIFRVEEELLVNRTFTRNGDTYTTTIALESKPVFTFIKPGETSQEEFYIKVEGEVMMTYFSASLYEYESFDIDVRAPPAPIIITASLPSTPIRIGDRFNISISVRNDGDYPITNLKVEAWEPFGVSIIGDKSKTLERLDPKETESFTFILEAKYSTTTTMTVYVSFKTVTGYDKYDDKKDIPIVINKKISTITCAASSQKITKGDRVTISGRLDPPKRNFMYLTFYKPSGSITEETLLTTTEGTYEYTFAPDEEGIWSARAKWLGDPEYENCTSSYVSFTVEKKGGCMIVTATYGSELAPEVQLVRQFRDDVVCFTFAGKSFISVFNAWYYSFSPSVSEFMEEHPSTKPVMKIVLYPLILVIRASSILYFVFAFNPEVSILVIFLTISMLIGIVYFSPIALLALYLVKKIRKAIPSGGLFKLTFIFWLLSIALTATGGLTGSPALMMVATSLFVISTITFSAVNTALLIYIKLPKLAFKH